jgi:PPK2 family polyphosphate:nucleotide phosphotransferase
MKPETYRLAKGKDLRLRDWSTADTDGFDGDKGDAQELLGELNQRLADLQGLLYAEAKHQVLVVLQGMDTSGKDGTIKHVFRTINPLGVKVTNFKRPNDTELSHDYLWRVHQHTPGRGHVSIFNRSHYEDVLVVRVHNLVPKRQWSRRYRQIRDFERMLADEGTVILKFFLHISKDEQKRRLEERLRNPKKQWKFEHGDIDERKLWDDYQEAYEVALSKTSTDDAPWYIVPSDKKWYRNLVINQTLIDTLDNLEMSYPEPTQGLENIVIV